MIYTVVFEQPLKRDGNYCGFVPDVPGCVSTGHSLADARVNLHEALLFHLEGMKDAGEELPAPVTTVAEAEAEFGKDCIAEMMELSSDQIVRRVRAPETVVKFNELLDKLQGCTKGAGDERERSHRDDEER